jgi:hypothetical protein
MTPQTQVLALAGLCTALGWCLARAWPAAPRPASAAAASRAPAPPRERGAPPLGELAASGAANPAGSGVFALDLPGNWSRVSSAPRPAALRDEIAALESIGYVDGVSEPAAAAGVARHDPARAWAGLNLYCSGHAPEAMLVDMQGRTVHRWHATYDSAFPGNQTPEAHRGRAYWRKVVPTPAGELFVIFDGLGIAKLDRDSKLLWARANGAHHDLDVAADGRVFVLTRAAHRLPDFDPHHPVLEDFVEVVSPEGELVSRHSLLRAIRDSDYRSLLLRGATSGDILHSNAIELVDGRSAERIPGLSRGNVLVSLPRIDAIGAFDLARGELVFAVAGLTEDQHDPTQLANGNWLVFDNRRDSTGSRILEIEPATQRVVWRYPSAEPDPSFFSACCGTNQRLPNGNTLVALSTAGRALEIAPDGSVVWSFESPHRAGEGDALVATLMDLHRYPVEYFAAAGIGGDSGGLLALAEARAGAARER